MYLWVPQSESAGETVVLGRAYDDDEMTTVIDGKSVSVSAMRLFRSSEPIACRSRLTVGGIVIVAESLASRSRRDCGCVSKNVRMR